MRIDERWAAWSDEEISASSSLPESKYISCETCRRKKGRERAQPQHRIYLLRVTDTLLLRNKPRSCSNKKQSCYLPLLTDNKVKELCRLHGRQVALPRKVDTWSITLMADDISPRRPSASLVVHPGWRFFTGINLRGQSVAIHSATKDDPLCLPVHLSHCGCCYVSIIPWLQTLLSLLKFFSLAVFLSIRL